MARSDFARAVRILRIETLSRSTLGLFCAIFILLTALLLAIGYPILQAFEAQRNKALDILNLHHLEESKQLVQSELRRAADDALLLAHLPALTTFLHQPTSEHKARLENFFELLSNRLGTYAQIRFIDLQGQEHVRINHQDGVAFAVAEDQLQDKSGRYYFQQSLALSAGQVFISKADLNVEHGRIEIPFQPMIRIATPVFDGHDERRGVLVINYRLEEMLSHIRDRFALIQQGTAVLISHEGDYLIGSHPGHEWGSMRDRTDLNYQQDHPEVWAQLQRAAHLPIVTPVANVLTLDIPLLEIMPGTHALSVESVIPPELIRWTALVHRLPHGALGTTFQSVTSWLTLGFTLLLLALIAWLSASRIVSRHLYIENMAEAARAAEAANLAKSRFLANMSHELRTPMNAILGFGQLMEYDRSLAPEHKESVREILTAGNHLLELINDILDLARIESGRMVLSLEPVSIADVVDECTRLIRPLADQRQISIETSGLASRQIMADRTRLKQVILNLLSNAVKYNREQGQVRVSGQVLENNRFKLSVQDTGTGISTENLKQLFQPFNRLDADHSGIEGTGVGLTLAKQLMELMDGTIGVHSTPNEGSCFWITLSLDNAEDSPTADDITEAPVAKDTTPMKTILYVDDNPSNIKLLRGLMNRLKDVVMLDAHTPSLGLELAKQHQPDLIILDINMPEMDGYELLQLMKQEPTLTHTPVMALTANAMHNDVERGLEAGFDSYLTKPLDVKILLETTEQLLNLKGENPNVSH